MTETEMPWDYPVRRIKELEATAYRDLLTAGETDAIEKMKNFQTQWIHTKLPQLLTAWSKVDNERKRACIDAFEEFGRSLKSAGDDVAWEHAATSVAQIIEMLSTMTPELREYACRAHARLVGT